MMQIEKFQVQGVAYIPTFTIYLQFYFENSMIRGDMNSHPPTPKAQLTSTIYII